MNDFYKKRYAIALYTLQDDLIALCDNVRKLAEYLGKPIKQTSDIVHNHWAKKNKIMQVNGKVVEIYFIDMREEVY